MLPLLLRSILVDLPSIESSDVEVDATVSIRVGESSLLDLLDESNDLRDVFRDASDGVGGQDVEGSHVLVESVLPEGSEVSRYRRSSEEVAVLQTRRENRDQRRQSKLEKFERDENGPSCQESHSEDLKLP